MSHSSLTSKNLTYEEFKTQVLSDYKIAVTSRECSILGRREVLTGKAKFGIFGDGKEVPQLAMARAFQKGDWRSGYYRDQTFMMALGHLSIKEFFAGLYAHPDLEKEPMSAGRQMGGHFVTHNINEDASWRTLTDQYNSSADISPTAAQMPRLVGLGQASKLFREFPELGQKKFSHNGNEVAWGTIGNASTSEGIFLEAFNAIGVLQIPVIISVWDDEYGISVPKELQTTKGDISEILSGFQRDDKSNGFDIYKVKGWDYPALVEIYQKASAYARQEHIPILIHVIELTQPQGHSTSGSHERYKSKERLDWESANDCNLKMRQWMLSNGIATDEELIELERKIKTDVRNGKREAWQEFLNPIKKYQSELVTILSNSIDNEAYGGAINKLKNDLQAIEEPLYKDVAKCARQSIWELRNESSVLKETIKQWTDDFFNTMQPKYSSHLYSETRWRAGKVEEVKATFKEDAPTVDGRIILRENFDVLLKKHPNLLIFGEDSGKIGDVNQGLEGLQEKYGTSRVADTGIREATIIGQGIGLAMRGLRPIAEIQYLDYLLYALQTLSDDLSTLTYRTFGRQIAPLIVRTRGHRLEGIWHSGSPMGGILNLLRGLLILVPRNMTKAAGFYNTLLESDDAAIVIECLNGYRLKEELPSNLGVFKTPIGVVEILKKGADITLVSYGSTLRLVSEAAEELQLLGIEAEVIDIQSLIPFDKNKDILKSVKKTNRLIIIDEDVPGGASAYILQQLLDGQGIFPYLDSSPITLTAKEHRPAYGSDGDYFSKPSVEDIVEGVYKVMNEVDPTQYPSLR